MAYFWWEDNAGQDIEIYFSQCTDGGWVGDDRRIVHFDYLDQLHLVVSKRDVDEDTWNMLLQVLNLDAT